MLLNIVMWIVFGLIAGALAKLIYPGHQGGGLLQTALLGIAGAFVGGLLHSLFSTGKFALTASNSFNFISLAIAIAGAIAAIFLWNLFTGRAQN
jgi:uncharacterized membrane protein YeaQ/YmgE (transglycosylase-associated protein family)